MKISKTLYSLKSDFFTFKNVKGLQYNGLLIKYIPTQLQYSQLGIIISKKVIRKSVERNSYKRIIRRLFATVYETKYILGNWLVIVQNIQENEYSLLGLQKILQKLVRTQKCCGENI